ncbi:Asp/Glu racemase [Pseudooceanicola sp. MF1-13]|uniref:maleate cis-trans isomerase family protein n=1 Tax=Pseudooceanicola sp. MF1-13 TaxID=3379095 RepID=UPI0038926259
MAQFPYQLTESPLPAMGLIVLQVDETIEQDFRRAIAPDAAQLYVTRVPSGEELTPETIAGMEAQLSAAAALLPPAVEFDVIGYACTSGTAQIGADRVRDLVTTGARAAHVTNPLTAALAAFEDRDLQRIGIVSPYVDAVADSLRSAVQSHGVQVPDMLSFGEEVEARVARIDPRSIIEGARSLAARAEMEAIFLSCTNLQTYDILDTIEDELGLPVFSSNQVLSWHMKRLAGM